MAKRVFVESAKAEIIKAYQNEVKSHPLLFPLAFVSPEGTPISDQNGSVIFCLDGQNIRLPLAIVVERLTVEEVVDVERAKQILLEIKREREEKNK